MILKIEIDLSNDAFQNDGWSEVGNILVGLCGDLDWINKDNYSEDKIMDVNGNTVGKWRLLDE